METNASVSLFGRVAKKNKVFMKFFKNLKKRLQNVLMFQDKREGVF